MPNLKREALNPSIFISKLGLEEILRRLDRHEEHLTKLREDLVVGFRRHDEEIARLRADMMEGFNLLRRHLEALGARVTPYADDKALEAASKFKIEIYTKV
jgi:hypothetical protein